MMHIVPQKRPTAAQILRHSWLWQPPPPPHVDNWQMNVNLQTHSQPMNVDTSAANHHHNQTMHAQQLQQHHYQHLHPPHNANVQQPPPPQQQEQTAALRGAVNATFRAISSPQAANVGPVGLSELARRRGKTKITQTHL